MAQMHVPARRSSLFEELMSESVKVDFAPLAAPKGATLVVFVGPDLKVAPGLVALVPAIAGVIARAAKTARFSGKSLSALDILSPHSLDAPRLLAVGVGGEKEAKERDF